MLTPPSTAGSTTYHFEGGGTPSLPRPPRTAGADSSFSGIADVAGGSDPAYGDISPPSTANSAISYTPTTSNINKHIPRRNSVYTFIIFPPTITLLAHRPQHRTPPPHPHLCTHCNETFRRIHNAKRHAFGALGNKNHACMGGRRWWVFDCRWIGGSSLRGIRAWWALGER